MTRGRASTLAAGALGAAALGAAGVAATSRRWSAAHDPTGGEPLCLPDGTDHHIPTADGGRLVATVAGDGPGTVVLAHGWTQDRRVWGPVARRLVARGLRVVLYDHRGHGGSTAGSDGYGLEVLAADLATVLQHVDARDAVLAGHSMGGMTAQALAATRPDTLAERVRSLVLVSTACDGLSRGPAGDRIARLLLSSRWPERAAAHPRIGPFVVRGSVGRTPALAHLRSAAETLAASDRRARSGCLVAMQQMDFAQALAAGPGLDVTIVCGTRDRLTPPARSRRLAEVIPGASLQMVPDAGHMLPWEAPDILADLLDAAAAPAPLIDLREGEAAPDDRASTPQS